MPGAGSVARVLQEGKAAGGLSRVGPVLLILLTNCSSFLTYFQFCRPAIKFMREVDSDVPCMGKVYYRCFQLQQKLAAVDWLDPQEQQWLKQCWRERWDQLHSDMHACGEQLCAALLLERMHSTTALTISFLLQAMCATLSTGATISWTFQRWQQAFGGRPRRCCLTTTRSSTQSLRCTGGLLCSVLRIDPAVIASVDQTLLGCSSNSGLFKLAGDAASNLPSWQFWNQYGAETPTLRKLAKRVLSKVCLAQT